MSNQLVTVDDFESIIQYSSNEEFQTPDPSSPSNVQAAKAEGFSMGTFHATNITGASWSLNFTGTSIEIFGSLGPFYGTYDITLDGNKTTRSAWASSDCASCSLFNQGGLQAGPLHQVTVANGNASMLLDYLTFETDVGAPGTNVTNTTVEETDSALTYVGTWGHNTSPLFSGNGSSYTNGVGASVSLSFKGSTIYIWGDTNANHGEYNVTLDSSPPVTLKSVTGCGLPYQTEGVCEQTIPGLVFFRSYLSDDEHKLTIENIPGVNKTFFDLDRIVYSTPNQYFQSNSSGTGGTSTTTISSSATSSSSPTQSSGAARLSASSTSLYQGTESTIILLALLFGWLTTLLRGQRL